ncbi:SoxY-related AACIE arm protein [Inquilinus limosus]|uniref:SoxY-related AACIE arm protein n=1 Tax=Inquilinus limosus TaxID=171674 RepID=UPI003F173C6D
MVQFRWNARYPAPSLRGGEADEAIQGPVRGAPGLLRCARNDGIGIPEQFSLGRRGLLAAGAGLAVLVLAPRPARARPSLEEAIRGFAGEAEIRPGRVRFDIPPLVENGNAVGVTVAVDSPMTEADHVRRIALFNEKNPQADIAIFHLGPRSGRASVSTRIRLATSQTVVALAEMSDGSVWSAEAEVIVTLAACIEDLS